MPVRAWGVAPRPPPLPCALGHSGPEGNGDSRPRRRLGAPGAGGPEIPTRGAVGPPPLLGWAGLKLLLLL